MAKLVSKVYGDALFEAAMERDMLSPVYEEVQSLQTILMENADLVQFLNHPQIIKEEKKKVVEANANLEDIASVRYLLNSGAKLEA